MINKFKKLPMGLKLVLTVLIVLIILWKLVNYYSYKETREHDRLPRILSNQVRMEVVNSNLYNDEEYEDGVSCSLAEQKTVLQAISEPDNNQYDTCRKFSTNKGDFYLIERTSFALVVLETTPGNFNLVIKDTGEYANYKNYPGINSFRMRGNQTDVIFVYEGWNNPRKIIKLTAQP